MECSLDDYVPGTNASVFSPQGGVRIGMVDLAKIGRELMIATDGTFLSETSLNRMRRALAEGRNPEQDFFCAYGIGMQMINSPVDACLDKLFEGSMRYFGHSGEAYGLQSGLWFGGDGKSGFAFFRTQAPPPAGGEDTGGFTEGEKALIKRAQDQLLKQVAE